MERFAIRIEKTPWDKSYLRIDLRDEAKIEEIRNYITSIAGVENVNITSNQAQNSNHLTAYAKGICPIDELKEKVEEALVTYFDGTNSFLAEDVQGIETFLKKYPKIHKLYASAKEKYSQGIYDRNVLDDLRLALELLLKTVLQNNKPLEKQKEDLGNYLKGQGCTVEVCNLFGKVLDYYVLYQNHNVKHKENINRVDMQTVVDLTMLIIKRLQTMECLDKGSKSESVV